MTSKICFLLVFLSVGRSFGAFREVKNCPVDAGVDRCDKICMFKYTNNPNVNNRGDMATMMRKVVHRGGLKFGNLTNSKITWSFALRATADVADNTSVTVYYAASNASYGTPVATCCGVPLGNKKCTVKTDRLGSYYAGVSYNKEAIVFQDAIHTTAPYPLDELAKHCRWADNFTAQLCLFVNDKTGAMEVKRKIFELSNTNKADFTRDRLAASVEKDFCAYQLPKATVLENGVKLDSYLNQFFNRNVYDVTTYWREQAKSNCTVERMDVDERISVPTKPGHLMCFRFNFVTQAEAARHYCMPGNETGTVQTKKNEQGGRTTTVTISLLVTGGIILCVLVGLLVFTVWSETRAYCRSLKTIPHNLEELQKSMDQKRDWNSPPTKRDEEEEVVEPLTFSNGVDFNYQTTVYMVDENNDMDEYHKDQSHLEGRDYIRRVQAEPVEGEYTAALGSAPFTGETSSSIDGSASSSGSAQSNRVRKSEASVDTGRGSFGSDNLTDGSGRQLQSMPGFDSPRPESPTMPDDVFVPAGVGVVGGDHVTGVAFKALQALGKRKSADSAVGSV